MTAGLSIGQVAERTGLSVHALRFYEREGILADPVRRDGGGRRVYSEDDIAWIGICTRFRASGMPLPVIRKYAELVREGPGNELDRLDLLRRHQQDVADQIRSLNESLEVISYKVRVYQQIVAEGATNRLWGDEPDAEECPA